MKNKVLLTVIFASFGFALFFFISNLQKAKNQMYYYEGSGVSSVNSNNNVWKSASSISKKKYQNRKSSPDKEWISATVVSNNGKEKSGFLDTSAPDLIFSPSAVQPPNRKKRAEESLSSDTGASGVFLTQSRSESKTNNENLLAASSNSFSSVSSTPSTFMGASSSTDDTIIDPGTEPTDPPIPVGDGMYAMMMLIGLYSALVFCKKQN